MAGTGVAAPVFC